MSEDRLYALEKGAGGPAVAFFHGFGDNHGAWATIQDQLAGEARTIAFDLPGHGRSLGIAGLRTVDAARTVLAELEMRGIGQAHLIGHSRGGAAAILAAILKPRSVASLTLLAPGGFGSEINHRLLRRYAEAREEGTLRQALENMYGWNRPVSDATVARLLDMRRQPGQTEKLIELWEGLSNKGKQGVIGREQLAALTMPVKVIWGTQDRVLPTRQAHRLPPMFAGHIFEDTGHMLPVEIPEAIVALIRQNLR